MSRSQSPAADYAESLGNYLSTYLCPVAAEKPYLQKASQADRYQTGIQFEELRVLKRAPPIPSLVTGTHNENKPPAGGPVPPPPYRVPVYEAGTINPGISYQSWKQAATPMADHELAHNVNVSWKNFGKPVSQSGGSWKTGLAPQSYISQTENIMLPGDSGQYQLQTGDDGVFKVIPKLNGSEQDLRPNDGEQTRSDHQSVSSSPYQLQYDVSCDVEEPLNYGEEMTKQRKLPNISTFRRFPDSYKSYNISHNGPIDHSEVTAKETQTRSYSSQDGDQWRSMLNKEQFNRDVFTPQKPKITPRQGTFYRDHHTTTEGNLKNTDGCCNNRDTSNQVHGDNSHEKFYDHGKRKYRCSVCLKSFSQTANLKAHVRIHTGEKPFGCPVCNRRFSQRSSVKTHMRIHSGERPFPCTFCKKSFYDSSTLIKHRRIHTGEKPYLCKICHQRFSQSGNLTRHYKLHTTTKF